MMVASEAAYHQEAMMAQGTAPEYAEDVTDLREAQRIIAALRRQIEAIIEECEPGENEFTAFLDDEHADMLRSLFARGKLYDEQDEDDELIDAFSEFVTGWVEVQWDTVRLDEEDAQPSRITPSA
jgi:hypothetical protein